MTGLAGRAVTRLPILPSEPGDEVTAEVFETFAPRGARSDRALPRARALAADAARVRGPRARPALRGADAAGAARADDPAHRAADRLALRVGAPPHDGARRRRRRREGRRARAVAREPAASTRPSAPRSARRRDPRRRARATRRSRRSSAPSARRRRSSSSCSPSFYESVARMIQALGLEVEPEYEPVARHARRQQGARVVGYRIGVDIGGTFTDCVVADEQRRADRVEGADDPGVAAGRRARGGRGQRRAARPDARRSCSPRPSSSSTGRRRRPTRC